MKEIFPEEATISRLFSLAHKTGYTHRPYSVDELVLSRFQSCLGMKFYVSNVTASCLYRRFDISYLYCF